MSEEEQARPEEELTQEELAAIFQQQEALSPSGTMATLQFVLCDDGQVRLSCDWLYKDKVMAEVFAEMVYRIISSKSNVGSMLVSHLQEQVAEKRIQPSFMSEILTQFIKLKKAHDCEPLIKPSQALKVGRQEG
jgi:hypothetical protein